MPNSLPRISLLALLFLSTITQKSEEGEVFGTWCIADEQAPDEELQVALDWACGKGGANCSEIQFNKSCFLPNTLTSHSSFAFNSYFQFAKHKAGYCYFKGAALLTELDPSYGSCHYEFIP